MKKKHSSDYFDIIIYAMMIVAVIYVIVQTLMGHNNDIAYKLTLGLWILGAVVINDYIEPMVHSEFNEMNERGIRSYVIYCIADAAAYASAYIFIINISLYTEVIHYIFLVLAVILFGVKIVLYRRYKSSDNYEECEQEPIQDLTAAGEVAATAEGTDVKAEDTVEEPQEEPLQTDSFEDEDDLKVFKHRAK